MIITLISENLKKNFTSPEELIQYVLKLDWKKFQTLFLTKSPSFKLCLSGSEQDGVAALFHDDLLDFDSNKPSDLEPLLRLFLDSKTEEGFLKNYPVYLNRPVSSPIPAKKDSYHKWKKEYDAEQNREKKEFRKKLWIYIGITAIAISFLTHYIIENYYEDNRFEGIETETTHALVTRVQEGNKYNYYSKKYWYTFENNGLYFSGTTKISKDYDRTHAWEYLQIEFSKEDPRINRAVGIVIPTPIESTGYRVISLERN